MHYWQAAPKTIPIVHSALKMGVTELVLELEVLEAKIKGAFNRMYCCYGNVLNKMDDCNLLTDDWAFCVIPFLW